MLGGRRVTESRPWRAAGAVAGGLGGLFGGAELRGGGCPFTSACRVVLQGAFVLAADGGLRPGARCARIAQPWASPR